MSHFDLTAKRHKIEELTSLTLDENFWSHPQQAQNTIKKLNAEKDIVDQYDELISCIENLEETYTLLKEEKDEEIFFDENSDDDDTEDDLKDLVVVDEEDDESNF